MSANGEWNTGNDQINAYGNSNAEQYGISMPQYQWLMDNFGSVTASSQAAPAMSAPTQNNPLLTNGQPNFLGGSPNLNPQYYGQYMDKLPTNMPGGGGDIIDNYGAAPWVKNWNTGSQMLSGPYGTTNVFNEQYYLQQNPDVAAAVARGEFPNALAHYNQFGKSEGRLPNVGSQSTYGAGYATGQSPGGQSAWNYGSNAGNGYYQPYQMMSGGGNGYGIPPIGTGPFAFNASGSYYGNPYQNAAQGSDLNISDAYNNARWDQYQDLTTANPGSPGRGTMIGGKEYNFAAPWQDSSTGSPFAGAQQAQGNTEGWVSSDTGPTSHQFTPNSFQLGEGGTVTGNGTSESMDPGILWNREYAKAFERYNKKYLKTLDPNRPISNNKLERLMANIDRHLPGTYSDATGKTTGSFSQMWNQYSPWYQQNANILSGKAGRNLYRGPNLEANPIYFGMDLSNYVVPTYGRRAPNRSIWNAPADPRGGKR